MTPIGVKFRQIRNLYVLVVFAPGSRKKVLERRVARRPWPPFAAGATLHLHDRALRIGAVAQHIEQRGDVVEHITEIYTRTKRGKLTPEMIVENVVTMPVNGGSTIEQFLWLHALVRRFDGDADAWLDDLRARGVSERDLRFVRAMRSRLRRDPAFLEEIRRMVDATPIRLSAGGGQR